MGFKDISSEIEALAQHYKSQAVPPWLVKIQDFLQQASQALQEFFDKLFRLRNPGAADSSAISLVIQYAAYLIGAIAILVTCYLIWKKSRKKREEHAATRRGAAAVEKILDSSGYRQQAVSLAAALEFKAACRSLYLCLLQNLHEKTVCPFAPAKTNYEYRYLLASYPSLQADFVKLADIVEHVWFGNRNAESVDYQECLNIVDEAEKELMTISARLEQERASQYAE